MRAMDTQDASSSCAIESAASTLASVAQLLRLFLSVQQRRASIYNTLHRVFLDYMETGVESTYQQLCSQITSDFSDCSKQVLKIESILKSPGYGRDDMAKLLQSVQLEEKQKLQMTAQIQVLKKAGHPSERVVTHDQCGFENRPLQHHCIHVHEISVADGLKDAEAEFEYDAALNAAIRSLQNAVTVINEYMEEVRYEVEELEAAERS